MTTRPDTRPSDTSPSLSLLSPPPSPPPTLPPSSAPITSHRHTHSLAISLVDKTRFCEFEKKMGYGRTNRPSYRDASTHLESKARFDNRQPVISKTSSYFQNLSPSNIHFNENGKKRRKTTTCQMTREQSRSRYCEMYISTVLTSH